MPVALSQNLYGQLNNTFLLDTLCQPRLIQIFSFKHIVFFIEKTKKNNDGSTCTMVGVISIRVSGTAAESLRKDVMCEVRVRRSSKPSICVFSCRGSTGLGLLLALILRMDFPVSGGLVEDDHYARTLEDGVFCYLFAMSFHVTFVDRRRHTFYPCAPLHICHAWRSA